MLYVTMKGPQKGNLSHEMKVDPSKKTLAVTFLRSQLVSCSLFIHVTVVAISGATFFIIVEFNDFGYQISSLKVICTNGA